MDTSKNTKSNLYSRLPEDFLKNIKIIPHNFDAPENPEHGEYVNM